MRRKLWGVLAALWICLGVLPALAAGSVPRQVLDAREQVYRVLCQDQEGYYSGSAFVVKAERQRTYLATNYHVIQDTYTDSIVVVDRDGQDVSVSVVGYDVGQDVCLLETQRALPNARPLSLSDQHEPAVGSAVYALGFPGAADYLSDLPAYKVEDITLTDGIINAVKQATNEGQSVTYLQMSAAISHGNSGGPLLDAGGKVLGINTLQITDGNQIFAAVSVRHLKDLMTRCNVGYHRGGLQVPAAWGWALLGVLVLGVAAGMVVFFRRRHHRSLAAIMKRCPPQYDLTYAQEILSPVVEQLRALHQQGRPHGAVSSENIFLDRQGKLRLGWPGKMKAGPFCSLELTKGAGATLQGDVYALGALLFTLLTGRIPDDAMTRVMEDRLPDQLALVNSLSAPDRETLLCALALRPQDRIQNAYVFSEKLLWRPAQVKPSAQPAEAADTGEWGSSAPNRDESAPTIALETIPLVEPRPEMPKGVPWHVTPVEKKKIFLRAFVRGKGPLSSTRLAVSAHRGGCDGQRLVGLQRAELPERGSLCGRNAV